MKFCQIWSPIPFFKESTGQANKIQISEPSFNLLKCFYQHFIVTERGKVEIKVR
jgi:hypothetical protein